MLWCVLCCDNTILGDQIYQIDGDKGDRGLVTNTRVVLSSIEPIGKIFVFLIGGALILQPGVFLLFMKANVTVTETVTCGALFMSTRFPYSHKADLSLVMAVTEFFQNVEMAW